MAEPSRVNLQTVVEPEVSVVLPCLNEERTLASCIEAINAAFEQQQLNGEIVVADNGSSDRSPEIAMACGARVVNVVQRGYGHALLGGIRASRGKYVVFADADGSYDFMAVPAFMDKLRAGDELVMGNRFSGMIHPGAMPWLHRYVGNPVLSWIGRRLFGLSIGDFHCGLRGISKAAFERLELRATGMEFATEMVVRAGIAGMRISEIPVELRPDGRNRAPHLRTWRDGCRHLRWMSLMYLRRLSPYTWCGVVSAMLVACLWGAQVWRSGWCNDESAHIPAGLYHWETGHMDAYRVNPPLPRMVAALPLLVDRPNMSWFSLSAPQARSEYAFAQNWISENQARVPRQLRLARGMMILFFLLGVWTIYRWTNDLYGSDAGWLAVALWSLSPEVITYSATVAPDLPAAASGLLACFWFWKWLCSDKVEVPWKVGIGLALATLCKFSWLFLFVLLPLMSLVHDVVKCAVPTGMNRWQYVSRRVLGIGLALLLTVLIINAVYGFDGTGRRLGNFDFLSAAFGGEQKANFETGNRFRQTWFGALPVPLPREMVQGIDFLKWEFEIGYPCYLLGEWRHGGWWYFYLVAMAVKLPVGYIILMATGGMAMLWHLVTRTSVRGEWLAPLVGLLFLALVSSQTGFTHHLRYVLPALSCFFIMAARSVTIFPRLVSLTFVSLCLLGTVMFHVTHVGLAHTHFNRLSGGPENGWRYLSLSNVDWGQSTLRMAQWTRLHPHVRPLTVVFVSELGNPSQLVHGLEGVGTSIQWQESDNESKVLVPRAGWYLLSAEQLTHQQNCYFRSSKPASWPYSDIALFHVPLPHQ